MLVFSPPLLPQIFDSLISNFSPKLKDATPANTLYMLARFACLTCDHIWLEELIIGAADAIEETFFVCCLTFVGKPGSPFIHIESSRRPLVFGVLVIQHDIMAPPSTVRLINKRGMRNVGFV